MFLNKSYPQNGLDVYTKIDKFIEYKNYNKNLKLIYSNERSQWIYSRVRFRFGIRRRKGGIIRKINNKGRDFRAELS